MRWSGTWKTFELALRICEGSYTRYLRTVHVALSFLRKPFLVNHFVYLFCFNSTVDRKTCHCFHLEAPLIIILGDVKRYRALLFHLRRRWQHHHRESRGGGRGRRPDSRQGVVSRGEQVGGIIGRNSDMEWNYRGDSSAPRPGARFNSILKILTKILMKNP